VAPFVCHALPNGVSSKRGSNMQEGIAVYAADGAGASDG
jgi:hypothetical protein